MQKHNAKFLPEAATLLVVLLCAIGIVACCRAGLPLGFRMAIAIPFGIIALVTGVAYSVARRCSMRERSGEFLDSILEHIPNMIFVKDAKDLRFVRFNRAGEKLLGFQRNELLGKNDFGIFPKAQAEFFTRKDREVLAGGEAVDIPEEPIQTRGKGERFLHTKKIPILGSDHKPLYLLGISEDITEKKEIEEARNDFVTVVTHQLRSPLAGLRWAIEVLIQSKEGFSEEQKTLVEDAYTCILQMTGTVNTLLTASRIRLGKLVQRPQRTDIIPMLDRIKGEYAISLQQKRLTLETEYAGKLEAICDEALFIEVLSNLVSNAIRYTPDGGRVWLRAGKAPDGAVEISVQDNGMGIPRAEQEQIFTKMFRASNAVEKVGDGTGFGLYVAKSIVEGMGGSITFSSEEGKGAKFTVSLQGVA